MGFFCRNAQEEALGEIARQMKVTNEFELLRELRNCGAISEEYYIEKLRGLWKIADV